MKIQPWQLAQRQSLPLEIKIRMSEIRIRQWYEHYDGNVYVSFSGGKDSTVLLHLVRSLYPEVPGVFVDTGLEYPEVREFVKNIDNVIWLRPKMKFPEVLEKYGYPVVSKEVSEKIQQVRTHKSQKTIDKRLHGDKNGNGKISDKWMFLLDAPFKISAQCCDVIKKLPCKKYEKETGQMPFVGTMAADSRLRETNYLLNGCLTFEGGRPMAKPLAFWLEVDIWEYLKTRNIAYSKIYDMGEDRTGCMFCMFGAHLEGNENRFHRMRETHPKLFKYCIETLGCGKVLDYIGVDYRQMKLI